MMYLSEFTCNYSKCISQKIRSERQEFAGIFVTAGNTGNFVIGDNTGIDLVELKVYEF